MVDHAATGRWDARRDVLDPSLQIIEPDSLPYGGTHHGPDGYVALMQHISSLYGSPAHIPSSATSPPL